MRLIDADALMRSIEPIIEAEEQIYRRESWGFAIKCRNAIDEAPTIEPETEEEAYERGYTAGQMAQRKKGTIQKFHDYQVEWLLSHCDLELEPQLEEWVVRFLHDTANCYMMEIDSAEGEQYESD